MGQSQELRVMLSEEELEFVRNKMRIGEYASEGDVVRDVISMLHEEQTEFEQWLRDVVVPRIDRFHADPSSLIPIDQVEANLAERRRHRAAQSS
jgi:antitoxin ParD1/3/4